MQPNSNTGSNRLNIPITSTAPPRTFQYSTRRTEPRIRTDYMSTQSQSNQNERVTIEVADPVRRVVTTVSKSPSRTVVARRMTPDLQYRPVSPIRDASPFRDLGMTRDISPIRESGFNRDASPIRDSALARDISPSFDSYSTSVRYVSKQDDRFNRTTSDMENKTERESRERTANEAYDAMKRLERENAEIKRLYFILKDSSSYSEMNKRLIAQIEELTKEITGLQEQNDRLMNLDGDELVVVEKIQTKEVFGKKRKMYESEIMKEDSAAEIESLRRENSMLKSQMSSKNNSSHLSATVEALRADIDQRKLEYWNKHQELNDCKVKLSSYEYQIQEYERQLDLQNTMIKELSNRSDPTIQLKVTISEQDKEINSLKITESKLKDLIEEIKNNTVGLNEHYLLKSDYKKLTEQNELLIADVNVEEQKVKDYLSVINELNSEITHLKYESLQYQDVKEKAEAIEADLERKNKMLIEIQKESHTLKETLAARERKINQIEQYIDHNDPIKYQKEIEEQLSKISSYENQIATLTNTLKSSQMNNESFNNNIATYQKQNDELRVKLQNIFNEKKDLEFNLKSKDIEIENLNLALGSYKDEKENFKQREITYQQKLEDYANKVKIHQEQLEERTSGVRSYENNINNLSFKLEVLQAENQRLQDSLDSKLKETVELKSSIAIVQKEKASVDAKFTKLEQDLTNYQSALTSSQEAAQAQKQRAEASEDQVKQLMYKIQELEYYHTQNDASADQVKQLMSKIQALEHQNKDKDASEDQVRQLMSKIQALERQNKQKEASENHINELLSTIEVLENQHRHKEAEINNKLKELQNELKTKETEIEDQKQMVKAKQEEIDILSNEIQFIEKFNHVISGQGSKRHVELENAYQRILNYDAKELASQGSKPDLKNRLSLQGSQVKLLESRMFNRLNDDLGEENIDLEWNDLLRSNQVPLQMLSKQIHSQDQFIRISDRMSNGMRQKETIELCMEDFYILHNKSLPSDEKLTSNPKWPRIPTSNSNPPDNDKLRMLENLLAEKCKSVKDLDEKIAELEGYVSGLEQDNQISLEQNKSLSQEVSHLKKDNSNLESLLNEYNATINKLKSRELELENERKALHNNLKHLLESIPISYDVKINMLQELRHDNAFILIGRAIKMLERRASKEIQLEISDLMSLDQLRRDSFRVESIRDSSSSKKSLHNRKNEPQKTEEESQPQMNEASIENQNEYDNPYKQRYSELYDMNHQLSDKIVSLYDQINKLETTNKALKDKSSKLNHTVSKNTKQIEDLRKENEALTMKISSRQQIDQSYKELEENYNKLQNEHDMLKEQYTQLLSRVSQRRSHILNELNSLAQAKNEFNNSFFSELSKTSTKGDK